MDFYTREKSGAYIVLSGIMAAHLGWIFEILLFLFMYGGVADRGFGVLPFCPIYGITLVMVYYLIGTPHGGGMLLSRLGRGGARNIIYFILATLIPSVSELMGGEVMERVSGEVLWSYEYIGYNYGKYICLPVSLGWGALVFVTMLFYDKFLSFIMRIPIAVARRLAFSFSLLLFLDFAGSLILSLI